MVVGAVIGGVARAASIGLSRISRATGLAVKKSTKIKPFDKALPVYVLEDNSREMMKLKTDIAEQFVKYTKDYLQQNDINFTMDLSDNIDIEVEGENVSVISKSGHSYVVEFGMPPGKNVNFDALRNWVEGKLGVDPSESANVTLKIMNKIKNEGISPTRFWKKSILRLVKGHGVRSKPRKKVSKWIKVYRKVVKIVRKVARMMKKTKKHISTRGKTN